MAASDGCPAGDHGGRAAARKERRPLGPAGCREQAVDVAQFLDHARAQDERIEDPCMPHAAVEAVDREGERQPRVDDGLDRPAAGRRRSRPRRRDRRSFAAFGSTRIRNACAVSSVVDDVQIVGPGLGEVLPRVCPRIGADVAVGPAVGGVELVVALQRLAIVFPLVAEQRAEPVERAACRRPAGPSSSGRPRGAYGPAACGRARPSRSVAARARRRRPRPARW